MEQIPLVLNVLIGFGWVVALGSLVRHPPALPVRWPLSGRRLLWGSAAVVALVAGAWGPALWTSTTLDAGRDPEAGVPAEAVEGMLRTPFAIYRRTTIVDAGLRAIEHRRTMTIQLPLALLAFLGATLWLRVVRPVSRGPGSTCVVLAAGLLLGGCTAMDDGPAAAVDRPDRRIVDVTWDTLAHVLSGVDDSLLFSASAPAADASGFWVLDGLGSRLARFDWEGRLRGYAGARGAGPGELMSPRQLSTDEAGTVWVLDVGNDRISAFDTAGIPAGEVSLRSLESHPFGFVVTADGSAFHLMLASEDLHPVTLDRSGEVRAGPTISVPDAAEAVGMALQGQAVRGHVPGEWIYAFSMGDRFYRLRGLEPLGEPIGYPEAIDFPRVARQVARDGAATSVTTWLAERTSAVASLASDGRRLHIVFQGRSAEAGRLLDRYDLESGRYLDTVLLPRSGYIAAYGDRLVLAATRPMPEILVLRLPS